MRGSSHAATNGPISGRDLIDRVLTEQNDPVTVRIGECDIGAWGGVIEIKPAVNGDTFIL